MKHHDNLRTAALERIPELMIDNPAEPRWALVAETGLIGTYPTQKDAREDAAGLHLRVFTAPH